MIVHSISGLFYFSVNRFKNAMRANRIYSKFIELIMEQRIMQYIYFEKYEFRILSIVVFSAKFSMLYY